MRHLTNYSIQKDSDDFVANEGGGADDVGHKWSLPALLRWLEARGCDSQATMHRIEDVVVKTLIAADKHVTPVRVIMTHAPTHARNASFFLSNSKR
jgi:hypothetical protein